MNKIVIKDIVEPVTSFDYWKRNNNDFISRWVSIRGRKITINGCGFYGNKMVHFETCECDDEYERSLR